MIKLTKLNKGEFFMNPSIIEIIESTPDTVITLINNRKYAVRESPAEIIKLITEYFMTVNFPLPKMAYPEYELKEEQTGKI